jgi:hypothetical protein
LLSVRPLSRLSSKRRVLGALIVAAGWAAGAAPQSSGRVATTAAAIRTAPVFFHGRQVAVLGSVVEARGLVRFDPGPADAAAPKPDPSASKQETPVGGIYVFWRERPSRSSGEIRGEFWDLGRLSEGDSRFSSFDFRPLIEAVTHGQWPARDQIFVLINATMSEAILPETATLRAVALAPEKYESRSVSVSGRFRGRNLYGDLPSPLPTPTKWDFVIQSADAAVWISGLRPQGKGFDLDPTARVDTARWVEITGTLHREGSRSWIAAREISLGAPPEAETEVVIPTTPAEPPPTVIFSAPVADEPDVDLGIIVRIQFSRDMDARSFKDHVHVSYVQPAGGGSPAAVPPPWAFAYNVGNRGIEIKFSKPLERFQTVRIELSAGIKAMGGDPLQPWALTFSTGK